MREKERMTHRCNQRDQKRRDVGGREKKEKKEEKNEVKNFSG